MLRKLITAGALLTAALLTSPALFGQTLRIGIASGPSSLDPQYHTLTPNNTIAAHFFDALTLTDKTQQLKPGLAVSWRPVNDTTWEFKLRHGVKFHDGSPFTVDDVLYSIDRTSKVPNSPGSFSIYTKMIQSTETPDPYTLIIHTKAPYPLLPNDLSNIFVLSRKASTGKWSEQLNTGNGLIGTGPFKFKEWKRGDRLVMERNESYWGPRPQWKEVIFKPISNNGARVAALLAGDVDIIDFVPTADMERLKKDPDINIWESVSNRVIYLHVDQDREISPFAKGPDGKNPLRKWEVRAAISKAINRPAIVSHVMEGMAIPAGQLVSAGFFGHNPDVKPDAYDPAEAKRLLAKAGYPHGFELTIHGPNDRYVNDEKIVQAVAQMLTQVGIKTHVVTMGKNVYFSRATKREFSLMLVGWGSATGEVSSPLRALLATYDKDKGMGSTNRGRYSNPKMDAVLDQALRTVDDAKREKLLQQAVKISMADYGIIPLHYQVNTWATRKGLVYEGRTDERTLAMSVTRK